MRRGNCFKHKRGLTLIEILISTVLIIVVLLAAFALYNASRLFYFDVHDKSIILYELQYAADHIYKYAMQGIGDETSDPGSRAFSIPDSETLEIKINTNDLLNQSNYSSRDTYTYRKSGDSLNFSTDGFNWEPLAPKVTITDVRFNPDGNLFTLSLTASYRGESLTFYSACYPRLATFR